MQKSISILLVAAIVMLLAAAAVFAAPAPQAGDDLNGLYQQLIELKKEIIGKYVDAGKLTPEQADRLKTQIDQAEEYRQQNPDAYPGVYVNNHCAAYGQGQAGNNAAPYRGMMNGYGTGNYAGMMGNL